MVTALVLALAGCSTLPSSVIRSEPVVLQIAGEKVNAELLRMSVPERYERPSGRRIELAMVRLPRTSGNAGAPIIYLAGGPGGSAIDLASGPRGVAFQRMREAGDVILLDQRGVGLSRPNLDCPNRLDSPDAATRATALEAFRRASASCAREFRDAEVELSAYNVVESSHDVDALRRALGYRTIILWGVSYGTQLGFAILRHHGDTVDRAVFAGVEGPDHTLKRPSVVDRQLRALEAVIAADDSLKRRYPDLRKAVNRILGKADLEPVRLSASPQGGHTAGSVRLSRFELEQALASLVGQRSGLELLPAVVYALDRGETDGMVARVLASQILAARADKVGSAMAFATDCSSGASRGRRAQIASEEREATIHDLDFPIPDGCDAWGVSELPISERNPVRSQVPILFFSGSLDGQTPVDNVAELVGGFPNAVEVTIRNSGHGHDLLVGTPEIMDATLEFLTTGRVATTEISLPPLKIQ